MKALLPLLSLVFLLACGSDKPTPRPVPPDVLSKDSMAFFLSQVHVVDAAMRHRDVRKENLQVYAKRGFIEYFDTAQVSRKKFVQSLAFWGADFEEMSEIYDLAMERLSTQTARLKMDGLKKDADPEEN
ncbi:MAG: DUF4296 domain-containing protein [Flavobacteriales bacterium]|nr:DUF4296 domain-containing protein [Flavobacteriales bacterium]